MLNKFSTTNLNLGLGAYTVPKQTFDFKAKSDFDVTEVYKLPDLGLVKGLGSPVNYSAGFPGSSSIKSATPPSTRPYIWK